MSRMFSRRRVILGLGGTCVALGAGATLSGLSCGWRSETARAAASRLTVALPDIVHPERLARWYLARTERSTIEAALDTPGDLALLSGIDCPAARRAEIAARVRSDFVRGDVVVADRIVAARTECVIAAACLSDVLGPAQAVVRVAT